MLYPSWLHCWKTFIVVTRTWSPQNQNSVIHPLVYSPNTKTFQPSCQSSKSSNINNYRDVETSNDIDQTYLHCCLLIQQLTEDVSKWLLGDTYIDISSISCTMYVKLQAIDCRCYLVVVWFQIHLIDEKSQLFSWKTWLQLKTFKHITLSNSIFYWKS